MKASIVVNYFNPKKNPYLRRTAWFALDSLRLTCDSEVEIICADGTGMIDEETAGFTSERAIVYLPSAVREPFAETYNRGCAAATGDLFVLCASDIFVSGSWLQQLLDHLGRTGAAMVCPYLSFSDYIAQGYMAVPRRMTFSPCCLTINLNALRRETWQAVGPLDTAYSGNYNDVDYLIRLRRRNLRVAIADCGPITHLGGVTLGIASQLNREKDEALFRARYPEFGSTDYWHRCWHPLLCKSAVLRLLLRSALATAPKRRRYLRVCAALRLEPLFNRY